jgi:UDP-N-acetyl-D-galactosamine dehydrogenase
MGQYVATEVVKLMMRKDMKVIDSRVLILGFTFKEDCPDVRNTRVIDIYKELVNFDIYVDIFDPWVDPKEVEHEYGIHVLTKSPDELFSAVILAVAHKEFLKLDVRSLTPSGIVYDVKGILPKEIIDSRL